MPKVSVIIPVHNEEKYLDACLGSVLNQTLQSIEIIAINDHSTDHSLAILQKYAHEYPYKLKVISLTDAYGVSHARNKGLEIADGDAIGFMDSDDVVSLNMYQDYYRLLKEYSLPVLSGNLQRISEDNALTYYYNEEPLEDHIVDYLKRPQDIVFESPSCWDKLFLHDFLDQSKFLPNHIFEDIAFTYPLLMKAQQLISVNRTDYCYRLNSQGIINQSSQINEKILDILDICLEIDRLSHLWQLTDNQKIYLNQLNIKNLRKKLMMVKNWPLNYKTSSSLCNKLFSLYCYFYPELYSELKDTFSLSSISSEYLATRLKKEIYEQVLSLKMNV